MFPRDEYHWRIAKARRAMASADVDLLLLVDCGVLLAWLTGYTVSETMYRAAFLPRDGNPWFVLRALDEAPCREKTWIEDVVGFADADDPHSVIAENVRARGFAGARIGVDTHSPCHSAATHAKLAARLAGTEIVPMPGLSESLRWVKSTAEIGVLQQAAVIADNAMLAIRLRGRA
jgi:Xaa-Pro dipeptidase